MWRTVLDRHRPFDGLGARLTALGCAVAALLRYVVRLGLALGLTRDRQIAQWAEVAYRDMVEWFDDPPDADWPMVVQYGAGGAWRKRGVPYRRYLLFVPVRAARTYEAYRDVAALVCWRVVNNKPGIVRAPWVARMVETNAAWASMLRHGFASGYISGVSLPQDDEASRVTAAEVRSLPGAEAMQGRAARPGALRSICSAVDRLGYQLHDVVGWEGIRALAFAQTWDEWLADLPPDVRERAVKLLELE